MARYFPPHVVEWLEKKTRPGAKPFPQLHALPLVGDLPDRRCDAAEPRVPASCSAPCPSTPSITPTIRRGRPSGSGFPTGVSSSNFPIALFDSPLPRRPTLAINLGATSDEKPQRPAPGEDAGRIRYARSNLSGRLAPFNPIEGLFAFLGAIFNVMQNWSDATLAELPGFRDRIVTIELTPAEGGLHLNLDEQRVEDLKGRGTLAGRFLVERFAAPSTLEPGGGMSWENHRWLRYRTTMATLRAYLARFDAGYNDPVAPTCLRRADSIERSQSASESDLPAARRSRGPQARRRTLTLAVDQLAQALAREGAIDEHAPRPLARSRRSVRA